MPWCRSLGSLCVRLLTPRHPLGARPDFDPLRPGHVDVAASRDLEARLRDDTSILDALHAVGFRERVAGAESPKHRYDDEGDGGHVEFVVPKVGATRKPPARFGGVCAERLDSVDLLLHRPWPLRVEGDPGAVVNVVNPVAFLAQKLLVVERRPRARGVGDVVGKRAKDWLYAYDTLVVFAGRLPELVESASDLRPPLTKRRRAAIRRTLDGLEESDDAVVEACLVARTARHTAPTPRDLVEALRTHLPPLVLS